MELAFEHLQEIKSNHQYLHHQSMKILVLIKRKAMDKKLEQCNRQADILLMYKHENYILELSLAAYELLKLAMTEYFANHNIYKIQAKDQKINMGFAPEPHTLQKPASGDASLAGSQQSSKDALLDKASRDALLAIKTYERGILHQSSSGDASLEKILQSSQNPASRDALLPGQQQSSGDASLDKSIEINMTNTDNSWDNLLMILCSICAKSVNGLVTPTYFLLPM
ncbi:unnamed protein product [Mytilus coruscus]|uniref:Uncharacterized protein n=1 Tax=Mytilus coruscus TaxID=42192 RepID=A0A6J8B002_MYTCO|nr:unnamed protein product [Mytilus coruscus]